MGQAVGLADTFERLKASERRYRTLTEYANDAIAILTPEGVIQEVNRRLQEITGYPAEHVVGRNIRDFAAPGRALENGERYRAALTEGAASPRLYEVQKRDGQIALLEVSTAVVDIEGQSMVFAIGRNVTEQHRSAEALRATEERMRFALESADVGIWDMDYKTGVLQWSDILEAQYGLQLGTFPWTFEAFIERVHPDDRAAVLGTFRNAMKTGSDFSVLNRAISPDGSIRWLTGAGRVHLDRDGLPERAVGISLDVTEHRTLETQFQQSQKMEAIGRLAGSVAHDFNNLLTVILGLSDLLLAEAGLDDARQRDIMEIHKAGTRATGLTRQLLAFSRKQIIALAILDLGAIITDMRMMLERLIGEDVNVIIRLAPALGAVKADRNQVEQVVMNLAVNARDAMPRGGTLTIERPTSPWMSGAKSAVSP